MFDELMTLDQFIEAEKARIDRFASEWRRAISINPQHYPGQMEPGEWDEQLMAFECSDGWDDE